MGSGPEHVKSSRQTMAICTVRQPRKQRSKAAMDHAVANGKHQVLHLWRTWDAVVSQGVFGTLQWLGIKEFGQPSPLTRNLPFVASPTPLLTCVLGYLALVVISVAVLKRRKAPIDDRPDPAWLKALVQLHNIFLIGLSLFMSISAAFNAWRYGYKFWGTNYSPKETAMGTTIYIFYLSKILEFMDTIIMILKGKLSQITLLHVYHHASISSIWWAIAYVAPGGDAWYSTFLNSFVHVVMYTYYLLSTIFGKDAKLRKRYLWWGRYLTQFQMFQFVTMMAQAAYTWAYSPYPKFLSKLLFFYMISLLTLFLNFYLNKHGAGSKRRTPRKKSA